MSKVYSFRLDENNPREAQARDVIDAWASKGYALRHIIIEALIQFSGEDSYKGELEDILEQISSMLLNVNKESVPVVAEKEALPTTFIGSISKSMKSGLKME